MEYFFWVSFGRPFWRAWFRACVCISQCPPCVQMPLLTGRDSIKGPMGGASLSITLLLTSKEPFCAGVVAEVPWLQEWEIHGLLCSIWAGPSFLFQLSCYWYFRVSVCRGWISNCFTLGEGGIYLLPQKGDLSLTLLLILPKKSEQWSLLVFYVANRMAVKPGHSLFPALICTQQPLFLTSQVALVV